MLFKSQVFTQASGSIGGQTFSRNRGGMYTRARAIPTNPNSVRQQAVRTGLTTLVNYWTNDLTAAERADWEDYAQQVPVTNRVGDSIFLTGQQQFIRSNVPREQAGLAMVTNAPETYDTGAPVTGIVNTTTSAVGQIATDETLEQMLSTINISGGASENGNILIQLGNAVSPAVNYYKGPYQLADVLAVTSADTSEAWTTAFASLLQAQALVDGQRRAIRMRITYGDGRLSAPYSILAPVVDEGT